MRTYSIPSIDLEPITDNDYEYLYYEIGRGNPGTVYKITHTIDKKTGSRVPNMHMHKSERNMPKEEIEKIKNNWLEVDTLRYEDIDPYTYFKSLYVIVKNKKKLPLDLQQKVFTTYLDPKISKLVKPKTKEAFGDILDNI